MEFASFLSFECSAISDLAGLEGRPGRAGVRASGRDDRGHSERVDGIGHNDKERGEVGTSHC